MIKELFKKKEEQIKRDVAVINPEEMPKSEATKEKNTEEIEIKNIIISSEALDNGTFRYTFISNVIYPIGEIEIK